jgi:hypothetical protein
VSGVCGLANARVGADADADDGSATDLMDEVGVLFSSSPAWDWGAAH